MNKLIQSVVAIFYYCTLLIYFWIPLRRNNKKNVLCDIDFCLFKTFLSDYITDPEVYLPGYTKRRCDRANRIGEEVCICVTYSISFEICVPSQTLSMNY